MHHNILSDEYIASIVEHQLETWQLARTNFDNLMRIERKEIQCGDFQLIAQLNPARIKSTGADVSKEGISKRACFLCKSNRPEEQVGVLWPNNHWELLVNPYPILPIHFTIVSVDHTPQERIPFEMAEMAEKAPSLAIFFNGSRAGASAPDHLHCQGVLKSELPIVRLVEKYHPLEKKGWLSSEEFGLNLPFHFLSAIITPDISGLKMLAKVGEAAGIDAETGIIDKGLVNAFFWIGDNGILRIVVIPRKAHRPPHYFMNEPDRYIISLGALDMAGLLILPREADFNRIDNSLAFDIYSKVAFSEKIPDKIKEIFIN